MSFLRTAGHTIAEAGRAVARSFAAPLSHKYVALKFRGHPAAVPDVLEWTWSGRPNRIALVNLLLHDRVRGEYLEIGCDNDALFDSVIASHKTGVDPNRGGNVRLESDAFFRQNSKTFDVIWVDGLHTYDQIRRDVVNSIASLSKGGWVGIHDLLPRNWIEAYSPRLFPEGAWSGDVWKVAFELAATPGIDFRILHIDRGVGVFRVTDQSASLVDLRSTLTDKHFDYLVANINRLPVIEWAEGYEWILASKAKNPGGGV